MPAPSKANTRMGVATALTLIVCALLRPSIALGQSASAESMAAHEDENVARLLTLLSNHYTEQENSKRILPSEEELALRDAARLDADSLAKIPFSAEKVRLNGEEGNTALALMSQRLADITIPESRRDMALICSIKTRLYGSLIASENRSLKPVGKSHYVAKVRLQPGESTLRVAEHQWQVLLPQNISASDYLITMYLPPSATPEFHVISIPDLLAQTKPHIPAWLPPEINLKPTAG
jgi:hypothetical protein